MPSTNNATTSPKCLNANEIGGATDSCQRRWTPNSVHRTKRQPKTSKDGGKVVKRRRPFPPQLGPEFPTTKLLRIERKIAHFMVGRRAGATAACECPRRHYSRNRDTGKGRAQLPVAPNRSGCTVPPRPPSLHDSQHAVGIPKSLKNCSNLRTDLAALSASKLASTSGTKWSQFLQKFPHSICKQISDEIFDSHCLP